MNNSRIFLIILIAFPLHSCHKTIQQHPKTDNYTEYIYQGERYKVQNVPQVIKQKVITEIHNKKYDIGLSKLLNQEFHLGENSKLCTGSLIELQFDNKINYKTINDQWRKLKHCDHIAFNVVIHEDKTSKLKYIDHDIYFILYFVKTTNNKYNLFIINSNINQYDSYKLRLINLCNHYLMTSIKFAKIYKVITTNRNFNIDNVQYNILNLLMIIDNHRMRLIKPIIEKYNSQHRYIDNFLVDILN